MVLLALFCYKMQTNHVMAATSFMGCVLLDYINGPLARVLEQSRRNCFFIFFFHFFILAVIGLQSRF